ncbi:MAG: hypothetical protein ACR2N3_18120 [Pyrinomonadaceae bacterium]
MKKRTSNKIRARFLKSKNAAKIIILSLAIFLVSSGFGCSRVEENAVNNASPTPAAAEKKTDDFPESLASVQTGNFDFVYVFRRPDGASLTGDDKKFLKGNSPPYTNQWVLTNDGKTAIAGSNYKFMPENLEALKKRFTIEDHSPKVGNGNQNSGSTK